MLNAYIFDGSIKKSDIIMLNLVFALLFGATIFCSQVAKPNADESNIDSNSVSSEYVIVAENNGFNIPEGNTILVDIETGMEYLFVRDMDGSSTITPLPNSEK